MDLMLAILGWGGIICMFAVTVRLVPYLEVRRKVEEIWLKRVTLLWEQEKAKAEKGFE